MSYRAHREKTTKTILSPQATADNKNDRYLLVIAWTGSGGRNCHSRRRRWRQFLRYW